MRTSHRSAPLLTGGRRRSSRRSRAALLAAGLAAAVATTSCSGGAVETRTPPSAAAPSAGTAWSPRTLAATGDGACRTVAVAAGDIVNDVATADRTGRLAQSQHPDLVLVLGDNQYDSGALSDYREQYERTAWGALKAITNPVPGNHEYLTAGAAGYFAYFGQPPSYYAYDAGCGWRGYALNSETGLSEQTAWLRRDLAAHPGAPVLVSWHTPRFSSGSEHGSDPALQPFWDALAERRGVVLNGHEHNYERFAPVGQVREFVVGTGGSSTYPFGAPVPGSETRLAHTPGVLRLELLPAGYRWSFLTTAGTVGDSGSG
jgi:hypothetical protein